MGKFYVSLNELSIPTGKNKEHAMSIAESLLNFCGVTEVRDDPKVGRRVFAVDTFPQDIPQVGIYWLEIVYPVYDYKPFGNDEALTD